MAKKAAKPAAKPTKKVTPVKVAPVSARKATPAPAKKEEPRGKPPYEVLAAEDAKVEIQLADAQDLLDAGFEVMCDRCVEINRTIAELEKEKKEVLGPTIQALMEELGVTSVVDPRFTAVRSKGTSVKLSPELLLKKGVSADTITECTKRTPYYYVQVIPVKDRL